MGLDGPRAGISLGKLLKSFHLKEIKDNIKEHVTPVWVCIGLKLIRIGCSVGALGILGLAPLSVVFLLH
jgi:hypothetical protein